MIRDIKIHPVLNGFVVTVGCQVVVFGEVNLMITQLRNYLEDAERVEKAYRQEAVNKWLLEQPTDPCPAPPSLCERVDRSVPSATQECRR